MKTTIVILLFFVLVLPCCKDNSNPTSNKIIPVDTNYSIVYSVTGTTENVNINYADVYNKADGGQTMRHITQRVLPWELKIGGFFSGDYAFLTANTGYGEILSGSIECYKKDVRLWGIHQESDSIVLYKTIP